MEIINFESIVDEILSDSPFTVHRFLDGKFKSEADVVIIGIDTIFDYEETRGDFSDKPYLTIAILESKEDSDIFKNFGIDAWIMSNNIDELPTLLDMINKKRG